MIEPYRRVLTCIIPGKPVAKGRPRMGRGGHVYTPERTRRWEEQAAMVLRGRAIEEGLTAPIDDAIWADMRAVWEVPRKRMVGEPRTSRPDLDNVMKAVGDALMLANVVRDDSLIWKWSAVSVYGPEAGIVIALYVPNVQSSRP